MTRRARGGSAAHLGLTATLARAHLVEAYENLDLVAWLERCLKVLEALLAPQPREDGNDHDQHCQAGSSEGDGLHKRVAASPTVGFLRIARLDVKYRFVIGMRQARATEGAAETWAAQAACVAATDAARGAHARGCAKGGRAVGGGVGAPAHIGGVVIDAIVLGTWPSRFKTSGWRVPD